jgi:FMN phosphatase YigB (HAD superfamily)
MPAINTVLFDLDGTLLPIDSATFEKVYFAALASRFTDMYRPEEFTKIIWDATKDMVANKEHVTNQTAFMDALGVVVTSRLPEMQRRFDAFYEDGFDAVRAAVLDNKPVREAVGTLKNKGYALAVATNPLFPRRAVEKRIAWTGFERADFVYVSSFEDNHYCKPHVEFYLEVLGALGRQPEECLMVGNDPLEDTAATKAGIKTYLITNHLIPRPGRSIPADYQGKYEDFLEFVRGLPDLTRPTGN